MDVAEDQGDGRLDMLLGCKVVGGGGRGMVDHAFEAKDAEVRPARWEICFGHFANAIERHNNNIDSAR